MSAWFSVAGELEPDDHKWYPGIFRALRHRVGPDTREVTLGGRVFRFSLCGSPVVNREASQSIEQCCKCLRHP